MEENRISREASEKREEIEKTQSGKDVPMSAADEVKNILKNIERMNTVQFTPPTQEQCDEYIQKKAASNPQQYSTYFTQPPTQHVQRQQPFAPQPSAQQSAGQGQPRQGAGQATGQTQAAGGAGQMQRQQPFAPQPSAQQSAGQGQP
ncbi:MAG: hypothetical protein RSE36_07650, partial [Oscillospiraceae bacterium]